MKTHLRFPRALGGLLAIALLSRAEFGEAKQCRVQAVTTYTGLVHDVLATADSLFVASDGGIEEFDRKTRQLKRKYTHLDGLARLSVSELSQSSHGTLIAKTDDSQCTLLAGRFECAPRKHQSKSTVLRFSYHAGARVTAELPLKEGKLVGTAGKHAFLAGVPLAENQLPDRHITALALFLGRLWVGTFNGGLASEDSAGKLHPHPSPDRLINALAPGKEHLFVGTSRGLYRTKDGSTFEKVAFVEDAVVGLAFDGTSMWATSPGAIYRIKDGPGPASDVWWLPGGSRSLQKVSAVPGAVWFGTEDRGAILMKVGPRIVSKDKLFTVFDRTSGIDSSWSLAVAALPGGGALVTTLREGLTYIPARGSPRPVAASVSDWGLAALATAGGAWIGTQGGAAYVSDEGHTATLIEGLPDERVHVFLEEKRKGRPTRLYIGTENGLAWCEPTT
jgi:hypothetical protein